MMSPVALLLLALSSSLVSASATTPYDATCQKIADAISSASNVYYPDPQNATSSYAIDISHSSLSSSQNATCSVEPGTAADVGVILKIVGSDGTPFAVKGGGHATNPGFSSTPGVQIAMSRFSEITYDADAQTVTLGAGQTWDVVYAVLQPYNVSALGGRAAGVGVAGFTLGGGFSWKTNQYGLAVDSVLALELVLPDGNVITVTSTSYPDLFFALRGGFNNFGIVTKFVVKTYPQTAIWGARITYNWSSVDELTAATNKFSDTVTDPKANLIGLYSYFLNTPSVGVFIFYDAPTPPPGLFDDFLAIPTSASTPPTFVTTLPGLAGTLPANATSGARAISATVSLTAHPIELLNFIKDELLNASQVLIPLGAVFLDFNVEPFLPSIFSHNTSISAYPPTRVQALLPLEIAFGWTDPAVDDIFHDAIRHSAAAVKAKAIALGQKLADAPVYANYALYDTPVKDIYGVNLPRLKCIREEFDPHHVMGQAGGYKI